MKKNASSFRDPAGFIYTENHVVRRHINPEYVKCYQHLIASGLYKTLVQANYLIPHRELNTVTADGLDIEPRQIPFISYPYEWSFGMLKDAALLTLKIHRQALEFGMVLKDASCYNIQFTGCQAIFIDTLSFDFYQPDAPWAAYGQFCRHFLAPLLLMAHVDLRLNQLLRVYLDGIPLDLADRLLHGRGGWGGFLHIHCHAKSIARHGTDNRRPDSRPRSKVTLSRTRHRQLIDHLLKVVSNIKLKNVETEWGNYYADTNYTEQAALHKQQLIEEMLAEIRPAKVWDLGANDGRYTLSALKYGAQLAAAFDVDPLAVERNYLRGKKHGEKILPLVLDLTNPSSGIGFANRERSSLADRGQPDCILLLAVIHHLAISNNLPLGMIAQYLAELAPNLIIEFVPKSDSQVQRLLACRPDIFPNYTVENFEQDFAQYFTFIRKIPIPETQRTLYLMHRK